MCFQNEDAAGIPAFLRNWLHLYRIDHTGALSWAQALLHSNSGVKLFLELLSKRSFVPSSSSRMRA